MEGGINSVGTLKYFQNSLPLNSILYAASPNMHCGNSDLVLMVLLLLK